MPSEVRQVCQVRLRWCRGDCGVRHSITVINNEEIFYPLPLKKKNVSKIGGWIKLEFSKVQTTMATVILGASIVFMRKWFHKYFVFRV